jgi:hypothetical protein
VLTAAITFGGYCTIDGAGSSVCDAKYLCLLVAAIIACYHSTKLMLCELSTLHVKTVRC